MEFPIELLQITSEQIKAFGDELKKFQDRFSVDGPGAIGKDLDKGRKV